MDVKSYFFSAIKAPIEKNSMVSRLNPVVCISILKISPKDNAIIVIKAYLEAVTASYSLEQSLIVVDLQ